jgi:hypothetical protein
MGKLTAATTETTIPHTTTNTEEAEVVYFRG